MNELFCLCRKREATNRGKIRGALESFRVRIIIKIRSTQIYIRTNNADFDPKIFVCLRLFLCSYLRPFYY